MTTEPATSVQTRRAQASRSGTGGATERSPALSVRGRRSASGPVLSGWSSGFAHDHAGRLAAITRREGASASDAFDVVHDALHTLLSWPDIAALRTRPDDAARLFAAIVRNAAGNCAAATTARGLTSSSRPSAT